MQLEAQPIEPRAAVGWRAVCALLLVAALAPLLGCAAPRVEASDQQKRAFAMYEERCKTAGEFIHKTVEGVEGIFLINVRTSYNHENQFRLDDPYGSDSTGDEYLLTFLRGFWDQESKSIAGFPARIGYRFVEAHDPKDGQLYRYSGRIEDRWPNETNKAYQGFTRVILEKVPVNARTARYGVRFDDISTRPEREHWIAGSSLKVIDMETQAIVAERIGYMVDWAQGSRAGGRSPWLLAANNACPDFHRNYPSSVPRRGSLAQGGQTLDFVETVLKPSR